MKTKTLFLVLTVILAGCVRRPSPPAVPVEDDTSIALPNFFGQPAVEVGAESRAYELDGAVMRALMIATSDYLRPGGEDRPCWGSPQAHRYRVIRQGDIIFVDIEEDLEACGLQYLMLDSGVTYAISLDGRILRRVAGASPEGMVLPDSPKQEARPPSPPGTPAEEVPGRGAGAPPSESPLAPATVPDGGPWPSSRLEERGAGTRVSTASAG